MDASGNSHGEVWDDSLLVNSWNDAVEEYKVQTFRSSYTPHC